MELSSHYPNYWGVHPYTRILLFFIIGAGIFFVRIPLYFIVLYAVILLPLLILQKALKVHSYFIFFGIFPFYLSSIFLYRFISVKTLTWNELHFFVLRTMVLISLIQVIFSQSKEELIFTLKKWKLKTNTIILIISSATLLEDIKRRSELIIEARFARGYVGRRTWWNMIIQIPFVLLPLFISILKTADQRAENWQQRNITELISGYQITINYSYLFNGIIIVASFLWFWMVINKYIV